LEVEAKAVEATLTEKDRPYQIGEIIKKGTPGFHSATNWMNDKKAIFTYFEDGKVVYTCRPNDNIL
jgi:hypothetical protein